MRSTKKKKLIYTKQISVRMKKTLKKSHEGEKKKKLFKNVYKTTFSIDNKISFK